MTIPPEDYPESFPYYSIFADCIAYWDFKDGSLYDVIGNMLLSGTTILASDNFGFQNCARECNRSNTPLSISVTSQPIPKTIVMVLKLTDGSVTHYLFGLESTEYCYVLIGNTLSDLHIVNATHTTYVDGIASTTMVVGQWMVIIFTNISSKYSMNRIVVGSYEPVNEHSNAIFSNIMFIDRTLNVSEIKELTSLLQKRYIYPTQQAEMQE